ncbi:Spectrin alpha chain, non-erythrocytic 1 [Collichthys lucidus]|uniref:Spectrin alpha chain, non-erythrocytic 1 n=1 Tax=Collichthys lucidus TaxID=240159 RepID=A0A4U5U5M2_COLLU|nr:Spectrin alpha chain, non-erythrocytic 1 [Collichthys lucidus]
MCSQLEKIEVKEEALILDNKYLAQQWHQLEMRMQHNLEQRIQARTTTGVMEEAPKHALRQEFKQCLRSPCLDLTMVAEVQGHPNRYSDVLLQEYKSENIKSSVETESSFQSLGNENKPND